MQAKAACTAAGRAANAPLPPPPDVLGGITGAGVGAETDDSEACGDGAGKGGAVVVVVGGTNVCCHERSPRADDRAFVTGVDLPLPDTSAAVLEDPADGPGISARLVTSAATIAIAPTSGQ
jgi:hypothetical protein